MSDERIETIKADTKDAVGEAGERIGAGVERAKRAVSGDTMPLGERVGSHVNELGHDIKAGVHAAKRDVRHDTVTRDEEGI